MAEVVGVAGQLTAGKENVVSLKVFLSQNRRFIGLSFVATLMALLVLAHFLVPTTYTVSAVAVVEKPQAQGLFGMFSLIPQDVRITAPGIIMQSEVFATNVAKRLNFPVEVGKKLRHRVTISATPDGVVNVTVRAENPELAVEIVNAYVKELELEVQEILRAMLADKQAKLKALQGQGRAGGGNVNGKLSNAFSSSIVELAVVDMEVAAASRLVHVIDPATIENAKQSPSRLRWVLIASLFALVFSVSAAAYRSYCRNNQAAVA